MESFSGVDSLRWKVSACIHATLRSEGIQRSPPHVSMSCPPRIIINSPRHSKYLNDSQPGPCPPPQHRSISITQTGPVIASSIVADRPPKTLNHNHWNRPNDPSFAARPWQILQPHCVSLYCTLSIVLVLPPADI